MRIGFDAKRAFSNFSGLGNYSRLIINLLSVRYPDNQYYLYIPHHWNQKAIQLHHNQFLRFPDNWVHSSFHQFWRSYLLPSKLVNDRIDLYHGLSNELPFRLGNTKLKKIVSIHDLIFMRFPHWYPAIDRKIYQKKSRYSCLEADRIIAISQQTKSDIVEFYQIDEDKIDVVYQGCDPIFSSKLGKKEIKKVLSKYDLPSDYMLYVGRIEERKNLLGLITAIEIGSIDIPLVVVGKPTTYAKKVKNYIAEKKIKHILFLENVPSRDLPALYQKAMLFIYPSKFEGFGLPILEAMNSRTPVITSKGSCFSEAGGKHTLYVDPSNIDELSDSIDRVLNDSSLRKKMIEKGLKHAGEFNQQAVAENTMKVYKKTLKD